MQTHHQPAEDSLQGFPTILQNDLTEMVGHLTIVRTGEAHEGAHCITELKQQTASTFVSPECICVHKCIICSHVNHRQDNTHLTPIQRGFGLLKKINFITDQIVICARARRARPCYQHDIPIDRILCVRCPFAVFAIETVGTENSYIGTTIYQYL